MPVGSGGEEDGTGEAGGSGAEDGHQSEGEGDHLTGKIGPRDVGIHVTKWEGTDLPSFTDPNGNPVQRGREAIFAWGGIQARPVIEKGDGSYLTSGYAKDALWTARRIAEANELGLNTADFWEAKPDDIQGKINQAKLAIARGEVPAAAAIDYAATAAASPTQYSQPSPSAEPDREDYSGGLSPELMEQAKREAWYRARYELAGPTNWTHYWDAARRARGFKDLPKWMLDLEMNWRVPPPEVMEQQEEAERQAAAAAPPAAPPAQYPAEGTFHTVPGPAPQYPRPVYPPDDRVYSRPGSNPAGRSRCQQARVGADSGSRYLSKAWTAAGSHADAAA